MMDWGQRWRAGATGWNEEKASPPLAAYVAGHAMEGRAIVPGCGLGHEVRLLAGKGLEVVGVDLVEDAITQARAFEAVGVESYTCVDWMHLPVGFGGCFDWVIEHAFLCALKPSEREDYVDAVEFVLRRGGMFLGVFYLDPDDPEPPPYGIRASELDAMFARFNLLARWKPTVGFPSRLGREEVRLYRK